MFITMKKHFIVFLFFLVSYSVVISSARRVPLLSNIRAPLFAELDVAAINEELENYIGQEIQLQFERLTWLKKENENLQSRLEGKLEDGFSKLEQKLSAKIKIFESRVEEKLENKFSKLQQNSKADNNALQENLNDKLEYRFSKLKQNSTADTEVFRIQLEEKLEDKISKMEYNLAAVDKHFKNEVTKKLHARFFEMKQNVTLENTVFKTHLDKKLENKFSELEFNTSADNKVFKKNLAEKLENEFLELERKSTIRSKATRHELKKTLNKTFSKLKDSFTSNSSVFTTYLEEQLETKLSELEQNFTAANEFFKNKLEKGLHDILFEIETNSSNTIDEFKIQIFTKISELEQNVFDGQNDSKIHVLEDINRNDSVKTKNDIAVIRKQLSLNEDRDGKDQDFFIIFHQGYRRVFSTYVPKLLVSSNQTAHLSVYNFADNKNTSVIIDEDNFEHNLGRTVLMADGIGNAGVYIHSNVSINIYGFLFQQRIGVSEGFLVIPSKYASKSYVIPTFTTFYERAIIAITPLHKDTYVYIKLKTKGRVMYKDVKYLNNETLKTTIDRYSTLQISSDSDLSGTIVTASNPVVVVSGNTYTRTHSQRISGSGNKAFIEMVLPIEQLDNLYIIPIISTRVNNTVRVQAVNRTKLSLGIGIQKVTKSLNERDHFDFYHTTVSYIHSDEDILVMIYPHELTNKKGDSFMMTIHGINQYLYEYDFAVPTNFDSFISVTVPSDSVNDFILDGESVNIRTIYSISEGVNRFSTFSMPINSGIHHLLHIRKVKFGLWVYGNHYEYDAYGYPAGIGFRAHT